MPGLVVFLHGLRGSKNSWGAVPDYIRDSLGFDIATPEYSASVWSPSEITKSARQVLTFVQTKYPAHDPIFLIGHSLGGLVSRDLCRQLLESDPDDMLNKIPAIILVGSPVESSWLATVGRYIPFISRKIGQIAKYDGAIKAYRNAIRVAEDRGVRGPKVLHIQMEDDRVIRSYDLSNSTKDDKEAGVLPKGHTNFANNNTDASYVANVLLTQIRQALNATSAPHIKASEPSIATSTPYIERSEPILNTQLPDQLILIACSHGKQAGGVTPFQGPLPAGWIAEPGLRQRVISKRSRVFSLLQDGKLADGKKLGGNRVHQHANQGLKRGPDLGGTSLANDDGQYLPAFQRYNGRGYVPVTSQAWASLAKNRDRVRVLIMSGLYGLIEHDEWIQNYDVHLTDTHDDEGLSVSSMWTEIFTESLNSYIRTAYYNRKVRIVNLMCDQDYTNAVQWHALSKDCSVYHLASATLESVQLLPPAGLILDHLLLDPERVQRLERDDRRYPLSDFGDPPKGLSSTEIVFESRVGLSKREP